jgi:hypothetical protein
MPKEIRLTSTVIRHNPQSSRLVTIPLDKVAPWKLTETTVVEGSVNGVELGRRTLKRWDDRNCWWIDLPEPLCKKARLETGDGDAGHPACVGRITERVNGTTKEEFDCKSELGKIDKGPTANVA